MTQTPDTGELRSPRGSAAASSSASGIVEAKDTHSLGQPDDSGQHPHEAPHLDPEMSDVPTTARRRRPVPLRKELPLLLWLVAAWLAMTRDYSLMNILFGMAAAWVIPHVFRLPPVDLAGRFHVGKALAMAVKIVVQAFAASVRVFWLAVTTGPETKSSIVRIQLVTHDDLILTAVSHALAIVPGSIVCEVDRDKSILYVHVLGVSDAEGVEEFVAEALRTELHILEIMGRREEVEAARKESGRHAGPGLGSLPQGASESQKEERA